MTGGGEQKETQKWNNEKFNENKETETRVKKIRGGN
jgi:hypothetical protein